MFLGEKGLKISVILGDFGSFVSTYIRSVFVMDSLFTLYCSIATQ